MMQQYLEVKDKYKDALIFYRLGDFYEMFFDDAVVASKELELTLTGRDCGLNERAPMCGVPYHAVETYIARLLAKGHKVVICEQMTKPGDQKGLVVRQVVREVTPGTRIDSAMLEGDKNNFSQDILCKLILTFNINVNYFLVGTGQKFIAQEYQQARAELANEVRSILREEGLIK